MPDALDDLDKALADLPVTNDQIRAWLDERNIPVFVGVQFLFAEVRAAVVRGVERLTAEIEQLRRERDEARQPADVIATRLAEIARDRYRHQVEQVVSAIGVAGGIVHNIRRRLAAAAGVPLTPELDAEKALDALIAERDRTYAELAETRAELVVVTGERDDVLLTIGELTAPPGRGPYLLTDKAHAALDGR